MDDVDGGAAVLRQSRDVNGETVKIVPVMTFGGEAVVVTLTLSKYMFSMWSGDNLETI